MEEFSDRCSQMKSLKLENIQGRPKRPEESEDDYQEEMRACLEPAFEKILMKAEGSLQELAVVNSDPFITEKFLWSVSCYGSTLQKFTYHNTANPPSAEELWALISGCREITQLDLSPENPRSPQQERFNNKCVFLITKNYPNLISMGVGGVGIDDEGLLHIAKNCKNLERLQLYNFVHQLTPNSVENMCANGFQQLKELQFVHTAVNANVLPVFARLCPNLTKMKVQVEIQDYFGDNIQPKDKREYKIICVKLQSLKSQFKLDAILQLNIKDCK